LVAECALFKQADPALEGDRVVRGLPHLMLEILYLQQALPHHVEVVVQELHPGTPTSEFSVKVIESFRWMADTSSVIDI
jgi:hypothetical protein